MRGPKRTGAPPPEGARGASCVSSAHRRRCCLDALADCGLQRAFRQVKPRLDPPQRAVGPQRPCHACDQLVAGYLDVGDAVGLTVEDVRGTEQRAGNGAGVICGHGRREITLDLYVMHGHDVHALPAVVELDVDGFVHAGTGSVEDGHDGFPSWLIRSDSRIWAIAFSRYACASCACATARRRLYQRPSVGPGALSMALMPWTMAACAARAWCGACLHGRAPSGLGAAEGPSRPGRSWTSEPVQDPACCPPDRGAHHRRGTAR